MATDMKLTPEMMAKIKDCVGFDVYDTFIYSPKAFRQKDTDGNYSIPKELWPIFTLKSKDGLEIAQIEDNAGFVEYRKDGSSIWHSQSGTTRVSTLGNGIIKIKNLPLDSAKMLSYSKENLTITITENGIDKKVILGEENEIVKYLRPNLQVELQDAINERSTLTDEERRGLEY